MKPATIGESICWIIMMVGIYLLITELTPNTDVHYVSKSITITDSPAQSLVSIAAYDPMANIPTWGEQKAVAYSSLNEVSNWFNSRYNTKLPKPNLSFEGKAFNGTKAYYDLTGDKALHLPSILREDPDGWFFLGAKTINSTVWHEYCHYVIDNYCHADYVPEHQESFCEVFANVHNTDCIGEYCTLYKTADVNREAFLDCYFSAGCGGPGYKYTYMQYCYEQNLK